MNARENYAALLRHEPTQWVPNLIAEVGPIGGLSEYWENGPAGGGLDGFGNGWVPTLSAGGQPALDPDITPLDDVCDWEDVVVFPDLDAVDWTSYAEQVLAGVDRKSQIVEYQTWNSVFLRFTHLLGFENALCAFYEEPEASKALCEAIADYKIALIERVAKHVRPDAFVHCDDVATDRSLFMSPETYREFIKPAHTRMNDALQALGIIPEIHVCGYCTDIIPDIIEEGSQAWQSAQPMNDLEAIIETYGDKLAVIGGYDTQGAASRPGATDAEIIAEVDRCIDAYGRFGEAFGFFGYFLGSMDDPEVMRKYGVMFSEVAIRSGAPLPVPPGA